MERARWKVVVMRGWGRLAMLVSMLVPRMERAEARIRGSSSRVGGAGGVCLVVGWDCGDDDDDDSGGNREGTGPSQASSASRWRLASWRISCLRDSLFLGFWLRRPATVIMVSAMDVATSPTRALPRLSIVLSKASPVRIRTSRVEFSLTSMYCSSSILTTVLEC